jgi:hypothetical protein
VTSSRRVSSIVYDSSKEQIRLLVAATKKDATNTTTKQSEKATHTAFNKILLYSLG